jgi:hypothetical protein
MWPPLVHLVHPPVVRTGPRPDAEAWAEARADDQYGLDVVTARAFSDRGELHAP